MNNIRLGKTIKAMYKLSGKTLAQLSEETDLTVDTINNLFYARIQKPGFFGVCKLVKAMGFEPEELIGFMEEPHDEAENADITEGFTRYIASLRDESPGAENENVPPAPAKAKKQTESCALNDQIVAGFREQIDQLKQSAKERREQYEKTLEGLKAIHRDEKTYLKDEIRAQKKTCRRLSYMLAGAILLAAAMLIFDVLNHSAGWLR